VTKEEFIQRLIDGGVAPEVARAVVRGVTKEAEELDTTVLGDNEINEIIRTVQGESYEKGARGATLAIAEARQIAYARQEQAYEDREGAQKSGKTEEQYRKDREEAQSKVAEEGGDPDDPAQLAQMQQLLDARYASLSARYGFEVTSDVFNRAKSFYEQANGPISDQQFEALATSNNNQVLDSMLMASGFQDETTYLVRDPRGKEITFRTSTRDKITEKLVGSDRFKNMANMLLVDMKESNKSSEIHQLEPQWAVYVAAINGLFDSTPEQERQEADEFTRGQTQGLPDNVTPETAGAYNFIRGADDDDREGQRMRTEFGRWTKSREKMLQFNSYLEQFGQDNPLAALVATANEELGNKMRTVGLNKGEMMSVQRMLRGVMPEDLDLVDDLGWYSEEAVASRGRGGGGGGSQRQIVMPDRVKIGEGFRELYRAWFRSEPSSEELEAMISGIEAQYVGEVSANREFDFEARMKEQARGSGLYARLFGNRPAGVSEEDYVRQFEQAGAEFLGGELASDQAIQSGLSSGSVRTTIGSIFGSKAAFENSSFRERVAKAAEVMNRLT
jgi:hypothetical protein